MKEFEKWQARRELKGPGYLTTLGAYEAGEKKGWEASLKWLKAEIDRCHAGCDVIDMIFEDELKT